MSKKKTNVNTVFIKTQTKHNDKVKTENIKTIVIYSYSQIIDGSKNKKYKEYENLIFQKNIFSNFFNCSIKPLFGAMQFRFNLT